MARVGVLALQGAFAQHAAVLRRLGHDAVEVRSAAGFAGLQGLILPGGESSVQLDSIGRLGIEAPRRALVAEGRPLLATCAGLILAAQVVRHPDQASFGFLAVTVARNAWGRQVDSFEAVSDAGTPLVFIRAPRIEAV